MSAKALMFAMSQNNLKPVEQLALIMIADCCHEEFRMQDAVNCISRNTSINANDIERIVLHLAKEQLIVPEGPVENRIYTVNSSAT